MVVSCSCRVRAVFAWQLLLDNLLGGTEGCTDKDGAHIGEEEAAAAEEEEEEEKGEGEALARGGREKGAHIHCERF